MSLIATGIEPHGVTRIFFDYRQADSDHHDEMRIARAVEQAATLAEPKDLPRAA